MKIYILLRSLSKILLKIESLKVFHINFNQIIDFNINFFVFHKDLTHRLNCLKPYIHFRIINALDYFKKLFNDYNFNDSKINKMIKNKLNFIQDNNSKFNMMIKN